MSQITDELKARIDELETKLGGKSDEKELDPFTKKQIERTIEQKMIGYDKRLGATESKGGTSKITDTVLDKVGEMLTDNIYDIIPGYAELEENFANFTATYDDTLADVK
jgi:hypothetical protein